MANFNNRPYVNGTAALKIERETPRNIVRLRQSDFDHGCDYDFEDQYEVIGYREYARNRFQESRRELRNGSIAGTAFNAFTTGQIVAFSLAVTVLSSIAIILA